MIFHFISKTSMGLKKKKLVDRIRRETYSGNSETNFNLKLQITLPQTC